MIRGVALDRTQCVAGRDVTGLVVGVEDFSGLVGPENFRGTDHFSAFGELDRNVDGLCALVLVPGDLAHPLRAPLLAAWFADIQHHLLGAAARLQTDDVRGGGAKTPLMEIGVEKA